MVHFLALLFPLLICLPALAAGFKDKGYIEYPWGEASAFPTQLLGSGPGMVVGATVSKSLFLQPHRFDAIRLLADGSPDASFGSTGKISLPLKGQTILLTVRPAERGGLLFLGVTRAGMTEDFDIALIRTLANGSLDPQFGKGGAVRIDFDFGTEDFGVDALALADGSTLVLCLSTDQTVVRAVILKLGTDGSLDPFFGSGGALDIPVPRGSNPQRLFLGPNGTFLVFGSTGAPNPARVFSARFFSDGRLDPSYGKGGLASLNFIPDTEETLSDVEPLSTGDYLLVGNSAKAGKGTPFVSRLNGSTGVLDTAFAKTGFLLVPSVAPKNCSLLTLKEAPSGGYVAAGNCLSGMQSTLLLMKWSPGGEPDSTFGTGGVSETKVGDRVFSPPMALLTQGSGWTVQASVVGLAPVTFLGRFDDNGAFLAPAAGGPQP